MSLTIYVHFAYHASIFASSSLAAVVVVCDSCADLSSPAPDTMLASRAFSGCLATIVDPDATSSVVDRIADVDDGVPGIGVLACCGVFANGVDEEEEEEEEEEVECDLRRKRSRARRFLLAWAPLMVMLLRSARSSNK
jgi:hypothetical protein